MKNEMAGSGRKYGIMLATWVAFGWPRPAFPASSITPGATMMPAPLAVSEYRGNSAKPLRLKLAHVIGASHASVGMDSAASPAVVLRDESVQPLRLKLAEIVSVLPDTPEIPNEPAKTAVLAGREGAPLLRLKLAEAIGVSSDVPAPSGGVIEAQNEDAQQLRLKLAQAMGALPAVATIETHPVEAAAVPEGKQTPKLQFAPVSYGFGGDFGYNVQRQTYGSEKSLLQTANVNVRAMASSFIWQPWFLQVNGGLGLGFSKSSVSSSKSSSDSISGDGGVAFLPASRFPFRAHFNKSNNNQNVNLGTGSASQSTSFGLSQQYRPRTGNAQYALSYDHNLWKNSDQSENKQDSLKFNTTQQFKKQTLKVVGDSTRNVRSDGNALSGTNANDSTWTNTLTANHTYLPTSVLSVETLANLIQTNYRVVTGKTDVGYMQLSTSAFWRPAEKPYTVSGAVRMFMLESRSSINDAAASQTTSANANLGANYEFTKHIRLNASGNVNVTETGGTQTVTTFQTVGASYQPDAIALGKFSYNRSVSTSFTNSTSEMGSTQRYTLGPSHGLTRSIKLGGGMLGLNFGQSASADMGKGSPTNMSLSHSGSVNWQLSEGRKSKMLRFGTSDSRTVVGTKQFSQLMNFQATLDETLNRNASWNGNLTIQASRRGDEIAPTTSTSGSSADLSYKHQRVFNVPRLRFSSDLRVSSDSFIPVKSKTPDQQASVSWGNSLDYSIGRTQIRLTGNLSKANKTTQSLLWFSLTRQF